MIGAALRIGVVAACVAAPTLALAQFQSLGPSPTQTDLEGVLDDAGTMRGSARARTVAIDATRIAALAATFGERWFPNTETPPETTIAELIRNEPAGPAIAAPVDVPVDTAACEAALDTALAGQGILFASGQAVMTGDSAALLPAIAAALDLCPDAPVFVEGHTDSQGNPAANLSLSLRRAEVVVDGLIANGIPPARVFAVGYGASLPIASNDTAEGRQINRRIVFAFEDIASAEARDE